MPRSSRKMRRRKILSMPEISLTPLIDTALTLLIIFMITAPMMQNSILVNLPKGKVKEAETSVEEFVVAIRKNGKAYFNAVAMSQSQIMSAIEKQIGKGKDKTVIIKADESVNYGKVMNIIDNVKQVKGVGYVALVTQKYA